MTLRIQFGRTWKMRDPQREITDMLIFWICAIVVLGYALINMVGLVTK